MQLSEHQARIVEHERPAAHAAAALPAAAQTEEQTRGACMLRSTVICLQRISIANGGIGRAKAAASFARAQVAEFRPQCRVHAVTGVARMTLHVATPVPPHSMLPPPPLTPPLTPPLPASTAPAALSPSQPTAGAMAWGAPRGIDDLVERVGRNDPALTSLCVLRMRRVDEDGCRRLAEALAGESFMLQPAWVLPKCELCWNAQHLFWPAQANPCRCFLPLPAAH